jgi:ribonuclease BN (tRNA processing enzyme)
MIDAGGGTFLRFGETGAKLADLSVVAISHLHPDHVADLPALLWLSETVRTRPLTVVGPSGAAGAPFPSLTTFLRRLFDADSGAYPVLAGTLGQRGQGARLNPVVIDASVGTTSAAHADSILQVDAIGVPHGPVPSLGYRVRVGGRSIVFGADQNGSDPGFKAFASGADLLVLHFALSATAGEPMVRLHARPTTVGEMARDAKPKQLLLSHLIEVPAAAANRDWGSLADLDRAMTEVRARYQGPVATATDLHCVVLP